MNVRSGKLNKRITFKKLDESKDWEDEYVTHASTWASVKTASAKDIISGNKEVNINQVVFEIRYRKGLDPDMVIIFEGNSHEIKSITDVGSRKIKLLIVCEVITNGISRT